MPELISCVIAASPICFKTQGFEKKLKIKLKNTSVFSWRGKVLEYIPFDGDGIKIKSLIEYYRKNHDIGYRYVYEPLLRKIDEATTIPVEKINGPVLMISGKLDSMWPSYESGEILRQRLKEHDFPFQYEHISYKYGSHFMIPMHLRIEKIFRSERKYMKENKYYKKDQLERTLDFLRRW